MELFLNRRFLFLLVAIAVGVLYFTNRSQPTISRSSPPPELLGEPDLYMNTAEIQSFRLDGSLDYELAADELRHFEIDRITRLTFPNLDLYDPSAPPWRISADAGYIEQRPVTDKQHEEVVFLNRSVELNQKFTSGRFVRLRTPAIYIFPSRQHAETNEDVIIDTEVGRTLAAGLKGDLRGGILHLLSKPERRIHTIILPSQFM